MPSNIRVKKFKNHNLQSVNKHINFEKESYKSNARKWATQVICITCKKKFVLPFKPRKPEIYCDECFNKR